MINHARTLLMNFNGPHLENVNIPGDIYIPPFEAQVLPESYLQIHRLLFGSKSDYEGLVYRANQYMGMLHSTEFGAYVYDMDARITYDPDALTTMDDALFTTVIYGPQGLHVNGTWAEAGSTGRVNTAWLVTVLSPSTLSVKNMTTGLSAVYTETDVKFLPDSTYCLALDTQPYVTGTQWYIQNKARPQPTLGELFVTIGILPTSVFSALFGEHDNEPYKTFYNLYKTHYAFPYQFSGLLLAYIQRMEELRTHDTD